MFVTVCVFFLSSHFYLKFKSNFNNMVDLQSEHAGKWCQVQQRLLQWWMCTIVFTHQQKQQPKTTKKKVSKTHKNQICKSFGHLAIHIHTAYSNLWLYNLWCCFSFSLFHFFFLLSQFELILVTIVFIVALNQKKTYKSIPFMLDEK